ncbi:MAG: radical SAM family heme chaperone HemW [Rhodospirillaceae bacterium]
MSRSPRQSLASAAADAKSRQCQPIPVAQETATALDAPDLALYVHWPFCLSKCPYCDFNSHVIDRIDQERWQAALIKDMKTQAERTGPRRLSSVFFGGGTPSTMDPAVVGAILDTATALWTPASGFEVTLEANPGAADAKRFDGYRAAGVQRLSLGVQSLNNAALSFLGRRHSACEAMRALDLARERFDRIAIDLIYARPGQSQQDWLRELGDVLKLGMDHVSLYQLTIEPGTRFFVEHARGDFTLPEEDGALDLFLETRRCLTEAGMPAYETSNHARIGQECRHNMTYWRGGDYLGVGPGAHGRVRLADGPHATVGHKAPECWMRRVEEHGHGLKEDRLLDERERAIEAVMTGLRLSEGIDAFRFEAMTGVPLEDVLDRDCFSLLVDDGLAEGDPAFGVKVTEAGAPLLNTLSACLIAL